MYERLHVDTYSPLEALGLDLDLPRDRMDLADAIVQLHNILEHAHGLAAVCAAGSRHPRLAEQDLTQALEVLQGYLEASRRVVWAWREAILPGLTGQAPTREDPHDAS